MNPEERRKKDTKRIEAQKAYYAAIAHLEPYFDLKRINFKRRHFDLKPETAARVNALISRHNIPTELKTDIHWIFGYVRIQYTIEFEENKGKWKAERDKARDRATAEGVNLYHWLGRGNLNPDTVKSITITLKDARKSPIRIEYPTLIYFILQAAMDKYSQPEEDETSVADIVQDDAWNVEKYTEYDKWKTADYLTYRKKETVKELYSYLSHKTQFGTDALCRFGAELMFIAGVPFRQGRTTNAPLHDTFVEDIKDQFLKLAATEIMPVHDYESGYSKSLQDLMDSKNADNQ